MMNLVKPSDKHFKEMMSWFLTEAALSQWSGPNFDFPFDLHTFKRDLNIETLASFSLLSAQSELLGFGQYYLRLGKCHLGRLVISPHFRGQGIAEHLMTQLMTKGKAALNTSSCSLFVLQHNNSAIKAYQKLGFTMAHYPEKITLKDCLYMVKP